MRTSIDKALRKHHAKAERHLADLEGIIGTTHSGGEVGNGRKLKRSKGAVGKRSRATPEEVQGRKDAILKAMKGTEKGKGMKASEVAEKAGLSDLGQTFGQTLAKMRKEDKTIKMEGAKANATWHLA